VRAAILIVLAACGGSSRSPCDKILCLDGGPPRDAYACNVFAQTGCLAGEKCTWIIDADTPQLLGHVACAPAGPVAAGAACRFNPPGYIGYDDCAAGLVCGDGTCKQICDQQNPSCDADHVCQIDPSLFGSPAIAAVCERSCDPLADNDFFGSGMRGSACTTGHGCFGMPDGSAVTRWTCERELNPTLVHRSPCTIANGCARSSTSFLANGCAQGYVPIVFDATGSSQRDCVAMCAPASTYLGQAGAPGGISPHSCSTTDARGAFDPSADGDHCMFSWWFERDAYGHFTRSPTSDTVGFCIDHARFSWPACATLPDGFGTANAPGAADFGCVDTAHAGLR
jgi:hypothetical protein